MADLITFLCATRRIANTREMLDNFQQMAADPTCFEILIKFDEDQLGVPEFIAEEKAKNRPFKTTFVVSPRLEGTFSLGLATEQLFFQSDPNTYFVQFVSDEVRFKTRHWDKVLRRYVKFFKDDIFRLRLSLLKLNSYASHYECTFRPDSFAIFTRRWLELTQGMGDCWASDAYQQCVAFHLHLGPGSYNNTYRVDSIWRDIPIFDIELDGIEWGVGVPPEDQIERYHRNIAEWSRLTCYPMQERFSYFARRIYCFIKAHEMGWKRFYLKQNEVRKTVSVILEGGEQVFEVSYAVPRLLVYIQNIRRRILHLPRHTLYTILTRKRWILWPVNISFKSLCLLLLGMHHALRMLFNGLGFVLHPVGVIIQKTVLVFSALSGGVILAACSLLEPLLKRFRSTKETVGEAPPWLKKTLALLQAGKKAASRFMDAVRNLYIRVRDTSHAAIEHIVEFPILIKSGLHLSSKQFKRLVHHSLVETDIMMRVPFNLLTKWLDRVMMPPPPGLAVLRNPHAHLPPRVKQPKPEDLEWGRAEVRRQHEQRQQLDQKLFVIEREQDGYNDTRSTQDSLQLHGSHAEAAGEKRAIGTLL